MKSKYSVKQASMPTVKNKMNFFRVSVLILISTLLSGCITIYEKYIFKSNGSGTMEYLIDMSEFYSLMQSFSENKLNEDLEIDQSFMVAAERLNNIKGISNIQLTGNSNEYIFGIKYDFANPDALNNAISYIFQKNLKHKEYIRFNRKNITRYSLISEEFSKDKIMGEKEMELDEGMLKEIFERMKYKISMEFFRPVRSVDTKADYVIDNRTLTLETDFGKILDDNRILETRIRLR